MAGFDNIEPEEKMVLQVKEGEGRDWLRQEKKKDKVVI